MKEGAAAGILAFGTTALCLVIGAFSLAIAARERGKGSPAWAWVVPGVGGAALLVSRASSGRGGGRHEARTAT